MSVMWVDEQDGIPRFNTTTKRAKNRHARRDPRVSTLVIDRDDPYRYLQVEGLAEIYPRQTESDREQRRHLNAGHPRRSRVDRAGDRAMSGPNIVELRQYTLKRGRRDDLIEP
jgi:hypothetical protein